jgi:hypothetical protein
MRFVSAYPSHGLDDNLARAYYTGARLHKFVDSTSPSDPSAGPDSGRKKFSVWYNADRDGLLIR